MDKGIIFFCVFLTTVHAESQRGLLEAIFGSEALQNSYINQKNENTYSPAANIDEESNLEKKSNEKFLHLLGHHGDDHKLHHHHHDTIKVPIPTLQQVVIHKPHPEPIHIVKPKPEHIYIYEEKPHESHYYVTKPHDEHHKPSHQYVHNYHVSTNTLHKPQEKPVYVLVDQKPLEKPNHQHKPIYVNVDHKPISDSYKPVVNYPIYKPVHDAKPIKVNIPNYKPNYHHDVNKPDYTVPIIIQIIPDRLHDSNIQHVVKPTHPQNLPINKPQYILIEDSINDHLPKPIFDPKPDNDYNYQTINPIHILDHEIKPTNDQHHQIKPDQQILVPLHNNEEEHKPIKDRLEVNEPQSAQDSSGSPVIFYKPSTGLANNGEPSNANRKPLNFWDLMNKLYHTIQNNKPQLLYPQHHNNNNHGSKPQKYIYIRKKPSTLPLEISNEESKESERRASESIIKGNVNRDSSTEIKVKELTQTVSSVIPQSWLPKPIQHEIQTEKQGIQQQKKQLHDQNEEAEQVKQKIITEDKQAEKMENDNDTKAESRSEKFIGESMTHTVSQQW